MSSMAKASLIVRAIIFLVVSLVIMSSLIYIGRAFGSGEVYKKAIAAKEIALTIDTLYIYPYDMAVYYEKDLTGLIVEISDNKVTVYNAGFNSKNFDPTFKEYYFVPATANKISAKLENLKRIKFEKSKDLLTIKKDEINKK